MGIKSIVKPHQLWQLRTVCTVKTAEFRPTDCYSSVQNNIWLLMCKLELWKPLYKNEVFFVHWAFTMLSEFLWGFLWMFLCFVGPDMNSNWPLLWYFRLSFQRASVWYLEDRIWVEHHKKLISIHVFIFFLFCYVFSSTWHPFMTYPQCFAYISLCSGSKASQLQQGHGSWNQGDHWRVHLPKERGTVSDCARRCPASSQQGPQGALSSFMPCLTSPVSLLWHWQLGSQQHCSFYLSVGCLSILLHN